MGQTGGCYEISRFLMTEKYCNGIIVFIRRRKKILLDKYWRKLVCANYNMMQFDMSYYSLRNNINGGFCFSEDKFYWLFLFKLHNYISDRRSLSSKRKRNMPYRQIWLCTNTSMNNMLRIFDIAISNSFLFQFSALQNFGLKPLNDSLYSIRFPDPINDIAEN